MISKIVSFLKKYFWIPLIFFISVFVYLLFRKSSSTEEKTQEFLEKNNKNNKDKIISDIESRKILEEGQKEIEENKQEKIKEIEETYNEKIVILEEEKKENKKKFEDMTAEELSEMFAKKYDLNKAKK